MTNEWTAERTAALISMWNAGVCASDIGRRLNVSKNAVIGKAFRLQLAKRRPSTPEGSDEPEAPSVIRLERLSSGMCSWPLGDAGEEGYHFCGAATLGDKPYCPTHCRVAYVPSKERKNAAVA